jgi:hypothetical protein
MGQLNVRAYLLVILFALGLFLVVAWGLANNWGIFRQPSRENVLNPEARSDAALEPGVIGLAAIDITLAVRPPSSQADVREVEITFTEALAYLRDDDPQADPVELCLDVLFSDVMPDAAEGYPHAYNTEAMCATPADGDFYPEEADYVAFVTDNVYLLDLYTKELAAPLVVNDPALVSLNFWYPYDRFVIHQNLYVVYSIILDDDSVIEGTIQPYLYWDLQTSGQRLWEIQLASESGTETTPDAVYTYDAVEMTFERPLLYRLVFPFFIIVMVLLIGLVPLLGDRDTLVDICAAMLFGIFGLKGILGPGDAMGQTLLDIALMGLYVVLAFAGLLFFINRVQWQRRQTAQEPPASP